MLKKKFKVNLIERRIYTFEVKAKTDKEAIKKAQKEAKNKKLINIAESETWEIAK